MSPQRNAAAAAAAAAAAEWRRRALARHQSGDAPGAIAALESALALEPDNARALNNLGNLLTAAGRAAEAVNILQRAIALEPDYALAFNNLGNALARTGDARRAIEHYRRAVTLNAGFFEAIVNLAGALAASRQPLEAIAAYRKALLLQPGNAGLYVDMGHAMLNVGSCGTAHSAFTAALELVPGDLRAQEGLVMALMLLNRHEEAVPAIAALRRTAPANHYLQGHQLHARLHCADWTDFESESRDLAERTLRGERVDLPMSFMVHNDSPAEQLACARMLVLDRCAPDAPRVARPPRARNGRLRIGYLSPDFREHPVAQLMVGVFEAHDRARCEVHAFAVGLPDDGAMRRRIVAGVDHFHDVAALSDFQIAEYIAARGIDVLVDLGGHTLGSRCELLMHRPAAVQIGFLGFSGSLGADFVDYIIADRFVIPEADHAHYVERVITLPDCYLPGALPVESVPVPTREAAGLPPAAMVYCCFNAAYKILPRVFDSWMRILKAVPDGILWLRDAQAVVKRNLAREAALRGVDPARLVWAPKAPTFAEHVARLSLADLFLDTRPYNAHTTASDALGAGVPVLTMLGGSFAARVGASLVHAAGIPELAVTGAAEYEALAIELAANRVRLTALQERLRRGRATSSLFDTARFCAQLEAAYAEVWARHERGAAPQALDVRELLGSAESLRR